VAALFAIIATAPSWANWTASGTVKYRDREFDQTGFTGVEPVVNARFVDVEIVDATTSAVIGSGATNASGAFSFNGHGQLHAKHLRPRADALDEDDDPLRPGDELQRSGLLDRDRDHQRAHAKHQRQLRDDDGGDRSRRAKRSTCSTSPSTAPTTSRS
jgi:hypothetical protein